MKVLRQQLADARDGKAEALATLAQLENGAFVLAKGGNKSHASGLLRQKIADYDDTISQLGSVISP